MSVSAVPTGDNGTVVDPTALRETAVSSLRVAQPPSEVEVPVHTGQEGRPDPYIYRQYITLGTFTWNTTQLPGTLLYSVPIHPSRMNTAIQQITSIYNAWGGSFDFAIKCAGTGFHAGALAFVRLPPNITPQSVISPADFTYFEYNLMDPKNLPMEAINIMDQRPIMYHYNGPLNLDDPSTFGGFFAVYVLLPLSTSSTGLNQINLVVMNRAGADLQFSQPRPPTSNVATTTFQEYESLLIRRPVFTIPYDDLLADVLYFDAARVQVTSPLNWICTNLNGVPSTERYVPWHTQSFTYSTDNAGITTLNATYGQGRSVDGSYHLTNTPGNSTLVRFDPTGISSSNNWLRGASFASTLSSDAGGWVGSSNISVSNTSGLFCSANWVLNPVYPYPTPPVWTPVGNETIMSFSNSHSNNVHLRDSIQTDHMYYTLYDLSQKFTWTFDDSLLFALVFTESSLPVLYMKLYFEGYFTTSHQATTLLLKNADYSLRFISVISRNSPVPVQTAEMKRNLMMIRTAQGMDKLVRTVVSRDAEIEHLRNRLLQLMPDISEEQLEASLDINETVCCDY